MSDFGDDGPDDAFDPSAAPDAEQVARRLHELRHERAREVVDWDALTPGERLVLVGIIGALLDWLRRQGSLRG